MVKLMNWKFWTWQRAKCAACSRNLEQRDKWRSSAQTSVEEIKRLEETLKARANELAGLRRLVAFKQRPAGEQPTEAQIFSALVLVEESNPLWRAFHRFLDLHEAQEQAELCMRGLSDEDRHYLAGRAAKVEDLRTNLLKIWHDALTKNREAQ